MTTLPEKPLDDRRTVAAIEAVYFEGTNNPHHYLYEQVEGLKRAMERVRWLNHCMLIGCHFRLRPFGTPVSPFVPRAFLEEEDEQTITVDGHPPLLLPFLPEDAVDTAESTEAYHARVSYERRRQEQGEPPSSSNPIIGHDQFGNPIYQLPGVEDDDNPLEQEEGWDEHPF